MFDDRGRMLFFADSIRKLFEVPGTIDNIENLMMSEVQSEGLRLQGPRLVSLFFVTLCNFRKKMCLQMSASDSQGP